MWAVSAQAQSYLPLTREISNDRPLFVFQAPSSESAEPGAYLERIGAAWNSIPNSIKAYSAILVNPSAQDPAALHARYQSILSGLQALDIPTIIVVGTRDPQTLQPVKSIEQLLFDYPIVKGVWISDITFNDYYAFGGGDALGTPPQLRWLLEVIDVTAKNGRFMLLRLGAHAWPHALANAWSRPLFDTLRKSSAYVFPIAGLDGDDALAQQGMMMGLWLQNATAHWGVECTPRWYSAARFVEPGIFGVPPDGAAMPPHFYRNMILNGAMAGATVYAFDDPRDLWFGDRSATWESAIAPSLREIVELGLIPRKELVAKKSVVAYQMDVAHTPMEMRSNLRDIDATLAEGLLLRGAYGIDDSGLSPELVPNTGAHFWVPILSPFGGTDGFGRVVSPNSVNSAEEWTQLLDQYLVPDGSGQAFVTQIGRSAFIMHTRENLYEEQAFSLPAVPAPVRGVTATRQDTTVTVSWPFREGDVTYRVYKRTHPSGTYALVADQLEQRSWTDPSVDPQLSWAYAVTALTNEREPYEGTVNYGDAIALSMVHSRIDEEAVITPLVSTSQSLAIISTDSRPKTQSWWPNMQGVSEEQAPLAGEVVARLERLDAAFTGEDLVSVMNIYSPSYEDSQGWRADYVKRAFQWFFERYDHCAMARQIRQWDFSNLTTNQQVRVLVYCRFTGTAISDTTGRVSSVHATFPLSDTGEVWFTWVRINNEWRIDHTEPALPNFRDVLYYSSGPFDGMQPGPDTLP